MLSRGSAREIKGNHCVSTAMLKIVCNVKNVNLTLAKEKSRQETQKSETYFSNTNWKHKQDICLSCACIEWTSNENEFVCLNKHLIIQNRWIGLKVAPQNLQFYIENDNTKFLKLTKIHDVTQIFLNVSGSSFLFLLGNDEM